MGSWTAILLPLLAGAVIALLLVSAARGRARRVVAESRESAEGIAEEARRDAEARAHRIVIAAEEKVLALEQESDARERALDAREADLERKGREFDDRASRLERLERDLESRAKKIRAAEERAAEAERRAVALRDETMQALERAAGLTVEQARKELIAGIEEEARREGARLARKIEEDARETAERGALRIVAQAAQRVRIRDVLETTVSFIELPSDEMKGRIIGREGRNIRALENATGIDLIVDDTPQAILISSFDPIRRQIARVAIERLVEDGRIHPARIEEVVQKVREETETLVEEAGTQAAFELGLTEVHPKLLRRVGRLRFHLQHGGNLLQHSIEVALLGDHIGAEVGARTDVLKRAGLFHEVARVDPEASGHVALASAELAGRLGESEEVVHAIQALHPEVEPKSVEAIVLDVANRIAENRPGARKENLDVFVERLRRIESVARSYDGVREAYAVKAGRELRVVADADRIDDDAVERLSREIARKLERELAYPGQIKVSVVRETRAVTFAV